MATADPAALQRRLRALPSVDEVLKRPVAQDALRTRGRALVVRACRHAVERARQRTRAGAEPTVTDEDLHHALHALTRPQLHKVINATGVVLHTNLGRAPLAREALDAALAVAAGYCNLEFDLATGERGSRYVHAARLLGELFGTPDALVVNNNAAAVLLVLSAICGGKEALVSRGELVEIGGGFRVPEVIAQGGARLKEVGTTNRTRVQDYARALTPETGALLKVHRSNFALVGFTEDASVEQLVALGRERGVPVLVDLGTGLCTELDGHSAAEPSVQDVVRQGADLVTFSGDKLLGGPQAGIILGRADLVAACREHPLCRALRVDKLTLAALEATLRLHHDGRTDQVPALGMLRVDRSVLRGRVEALAQALQGTPAHTEPREVMARAGGGTMPQWEVPSVALALRVPGVGAEELAARLRAATPPVVTRRGDDAVLVDLRTVPPEEDTLVHAVLRAALVGDSRGGSSC